jgi:hypothetical protein
MINEPIAPVLHETNARLPLLAFQTPNADSALNPDDSLAHGRAAEATPGIVKPGQRAIAPEERAAR